MLNRFSSRPRNLNALAEIFSFKAQCSIATTSSSPKYSASRTRNLFSRINPFRQDYDVVRVLDQWVDEGQKLHRLELRQIIRQLRTHRRFNQALQVSEWICRNAIHEFSPGDFAVHLDLIGVVRGCEAAERYFNNLGDKNKNEKTYGALLNCYVREGLLTKTLLHMQNMKDKGYASSSLAYNNLMALYKKSGQLEKIPEVLSEMKKDGVLPNNFTYRICIDSFSERSDLSGMEKLVDEIELQTNVPMDWATCSVVAYHFIKENKEKALTYMKKLEEKLDKDAMGYNHLISLYAHLGDKDEMMRLWDLQKTACKKQINRDYITILGSLVKLGEFDESEALLKEWDLSCRTYDFRVPNILLIGYCQKGLVEKSEKLLRDIVDRGEKPTPNSWAIVANGYLDSDNMEKAFECMKKALAVKEHNVKWIPKPCQITKILEWLGDNGEIEEVEAFVWSLRGVIPVNSEMYLSLIKASMRVGGDIGRILCSMKADEIVVDDEMQKLLATG